MCLNFGVEFPSTFLTLKLFTTQMLAFNVFFEVPFFFKLFVTNFTFPCVRSRAIGGFPAYFQMLFHVKNAYFAMQTLLFGLMCFQVPN